VADLGDIIKSVDSEKVMLRWSDESRGIEWTCKSEMLSSKLDMLPWIWDWDSLPGHSPAVLWLCFPI